MRGALYIKLLYRTVSRIIPAYAGSTAALLVGEPLAEDHPRVCGEHTPCAVIGLDS